VPSTYSSTGITSTPAPTPIAPPSAPIPANSSMASAWVRAGASALAGRSAADGGCAMRATMDVFSRWVRTRVPSEVGLRPYRFEAPSR